jgi:8-oxo-dGTP pyrophosphatase MutT (NUDIX family)
MTDDEKPSSAEEVATAERLRVQAAEARQRETAARRELFIETGAELAHAINRAYCNFLGDASQPHWDDAPEWQKESAKIGIELHFERPDLTPEESHQSWMDHKTIEGWKYGPVKDPEKKEHPCMVPYRELPRDQRLKDYLFKAVANFMKEKLDDAQ